MKKTEDKSLILLRGLPGAGKSTLAEMLCGDKWPVFSVDDFFTNNETGDYQFDFRKNHLAYEACITNTEGALKKGTARIFVHNCFALEWELEPYLELAKKYKYRVFVLTVENRHGSKSTHGISDAQMSKMSAKFKPKLF